MQSATSTQGKIKVEVANFPRPAGEGKGRGFTRLLHQTLWCGLCQRFASKKNYKRDLRMSETCTREKGICSALQFEL